MIFNVKSCIFLLGDKMILMIDNYDSFTYNIVSYLRILKEEVLVKKNDEINLNEVKRLNPEIIVISPGPKTPKESKISLEIFEQFKGEYPILGVCLGHQALAYSIGLDIIKGPRPMHGKMTEINHDSKGIFADIPNHVKVMRYHSLIVDDSKFENEKYEDLVITSRTDDGIIMGFRDSKNKIETVQFHPESVGTDFGLKMIENFLKEVRNDSF